jgi:hypothetical protein
MDLNCGLDGVYAGRFVLVEYDSEIQEDSFKDFYYDGLDMYTAADTKQSLLDSNLIIITEFKENNKVFGGTVTQNNIVANKTIVRVGPYKRRFNANKDTIYVKNLGSGKYLEVTEEDYKKYKSEKGSSYDPESLTTNKTYIVNGILQILSQDYNQIGNILPVEAGKSYTTNTTESFWIATVEETVNSNNQYPVTWKELSASDTTYVKNHSIDIAWYGDSRGFDSTVWQKVYSSGSEKYVMVAELNTVVPTFAISADAPTMLPIVPHFDTDSTNVYYKVHWQPQWGVRIKSANSSLKGKQLAQNGDWIPNTSISLTSDETFYPSDQKTYWKRDYYSSLENKKIETYYDEENSSWGTDKNFIDAAIYFNKDGFDSDIISYSEDLSVLGRNNYNPKVNWDQKDNISLLPTGLSGTVYNPHDGYIDLKPMEDIQELSIMLPGVGDTIAHVWDLIYGGRTTNSEIGKTSKRNTDISWEDAKNTLNRQGLRLVGHGTNIYNKAEVNTLAGSINTAHDLMGMIIASVNDSDSIDPENTNNSIGAFNEDRIYCVKSTGEYYRKHKTYEYTELSKENYEYKEISSLPSNANILEYFIKKDDNTYVQAEKESKGPYYERYLNVENEYSEVNLNPFPPTLQDSNGQEIICRYRDYTGNIDIPDSIYEGIKEDAGREAAKAEYIKLHSDYIYDTKYYSGKTYYNVTISDPVSLSAEYTPKTYWYKKEDEWEDEQQTSKEGYTIDNSLSITKNRTYLIFHQENAIEITKIPEHNYNGIYIPGVYYYAQYNVVDKNMELSDLKRNLANGVKYYQKSSGSPSWFEIEGGTREDGSEFTAESVLEEAYNNPSYSIATVSYILDKNETAQPKTVYYSIASQIVEDGNKYQVITVYEKINVDETNYISGLYYIYDNDIYKLSSDPYDASKEYYRQTEKLEPVTNSIVLDLGKPFSLISFVDGLFYTYSSELSTGSQSFDVVRKTDIDPKKDTTYYVLGYNKETGSIKQEDLKESDKAFTQQNEFYQSGVYHYESDGSYLLATNKSYMEDKAPYFTLTDVKEVTLENVYEPYEYYEKETINGEDNYTLVKDDTISDQKTLYKRDSLYVMEDETGTYNKGAIWNFEAKKVPATLVLGKRTNAWDMVKLKDYAKNLNTQNGLILKTNQVLEYDDDLTRDTRTVNGCINYLQDIIARFHKMVPGQIMIVDDYGRLHSAQHEGDDWLKITVDSNVNEPKITLNHRPKTVDETAKSGTDLNDPKEDTITIQDITFDTTGHVQTNQKHTYTLPYGFKTIKTDGTNSSVKDIEIKDDQKKPIVADNTQDELTINPGNNWIKIANDAENDIVIIAHEVHSIDEKTEKNETNLNSSKEDAITLKDITFDEAGHIKANQPHEYILPYGFKYIKTNGRGSSTIENATDTPTITTVEADNTQDTLVLNSGNKWIRIDSVDETTNSLTFSHDIHTITTSTSTVDFNESGNTFSIPTLSYDEAGHITSKATCTYTLPNSFKTFKIYKEYDTTSSDDIKEIIASGILDTLSIQPNNKWITLDVDSKDDHKLVIKHMELRTEDESRGETTDQYPAFGKTFRALSVKVDKAGHVTDLASHTVTIPLPSLTDEDEGNVVTDLTLNASAGAFTESKNYIGSLSITGFTHSYSGATLLSNTDSLNTALAALEKAILEEINSRETAIQDLDMTEISAETGQIIEKVSQEDGKVSASVRALTADDIPTLTLTKISDAGSMAAENANDYLTKETIEKTYITSNTQFTYEAPTEDESDPDDKFDDRDTTIEWLFQKVAQLEKIINELQLAKV